MLFPKSFFVRSQDLDEIFCDAGQFYWAHKKTWLTEKKLFSKKSNFVDKFMKNLSKNNNFTSVRS